MPGKPFMVISPELWLMLASAGGNTAKTIKLLHQPINWDIFLQLAIHHRVYPLVYKMLSQLNNPAVPEYVLGLLRHKYQENAIKALSTAGETVRVVKCFDSYGIWSVVLKGAPLAWYLYGDIAIRPSKDIDILVPPDDLEKAQGLLEKEGYRKIENQHNLTPRQLKIYTRAFTHPFHINYWHSKKNINLELHWKTSSRGFEIPLSPEGNINRIRVAGSPLPVFSDEEWLLYLILHGSGHAWFRIRWLVDIARFIQQIGIDWEKTNFLAKKIGMQAILHQSMFLASRLLDVPTPSNLNKTEANDKLAKRLACSAMRLCLTRADYEIRGSNGEYINYWQIKYWPITYGLQIRKGWKSRLKYVLKLLGPNVNDIKLISLPDRLYALYYVIRPFNILGRRLQRFIKVK